MLLKNPFNTLTPGGVAKTTPRFIPICCGCNNVRDDSRRDEREPGWGTLDAYLHTHHLTSGDYRLTHTYCPSCSVRFSKLSGGHAVTPEVAASRSL
ncbi:MAG: hypothetical protein WBO67_19975 [Nitrospira sp.]